MTTLDQIQRLLPHVNDEGVSRSYRIIDGQFVHMHYGWKTQCIKVMTTEEDLAGILDILALIYANEMRVSKKLVLAAFGR